jgi:hypothetical protein
MQETLRLALQHRRRGRGSSASGLKKLNATSQA